MTACGYFITGTDTGVGKTRVACLLVESLKRQGLRVAVMKPVAAGIDRDGMNEDVRLLVASSNVEAPLDLVNPYCFAPAVAPHLAARQAGVVMDLNVIAEAYERLASMSDVVVVEGAGGFLVPLNDDAGMDAIPVHLQLQVVMVVGLRLGCLNHAMLTAEAVRARGLKLAGWVANHIDPGMSLPEENVTTLRSILRSPCLGELGWKGDTFNGTDSERDLIFHAVGLTKSAIQNTQK